jgi:hypothetical protein
MQGFPLDPRQKSPKNQSFQAAKLAGVTKKPERKASRLQNAASRD